MRSTFLDEWQAEKRLVYGTSKLQIWYLSHSICHGWWWLIERHLLVIAATTTTHSFIQLVYVVPTSFYSMVVGRSFVRFSRREKRKLSAQSQYSRKLLRIQAERKSEFIEYGMVAVLLSSQRSLQTRWYNIQANLQVTSE